MLVVRPGWLTRNPLGEPEQTLTETFEKLYRMLGRVTAGLLIAALAIFGLALCLALLGLRHPAESFDQVAKTLTFLFAGMLGLFLVTSLVAAIVRWLDRRSRPKAKPIEEPNEDLSPRSDCAEERR
jgi:hypothetical protein